jgi:hypothetical protein
MAGPHNVAAGERRGLANICNKLLLPSVNTSSSPTFLSGPPSDPSSYHEYLTSGIIFDNSAIGLEDRDYYTRRQKRFGAMEPNLKVLLEDLMKQVRDEIKQSHEEIMAFFDSHISTVNRRISDFTAEEQKREERVSALESSTMTFKAAFNEWKPQVEGSIHSVKLKLSKLNTYFLHDAKDVSSTKPGVLHSESAQGRHPVGSAADGPSGHRVEHHHRDCGYGDVYTLTHDPVKDSVSPPMPPPPHTLQIKSSYPRDPFRQSPHVSPSSRSPTRRLPKLNFPKFEGDNPKLWKSCCENYFEMYEIEETLWVKIAAMHSEGPAARWLQSVERRVWSATWTELCSWIHQRFSKDEHELLISQLYKIKHVGSVQDYIVKFYECRYPEDRVPPYTRSKSR